MLKTTKIVSLFTALLLPLSNSLLANSPYEEYEQAKYSSDLEVGDTAKDMIMKLCGSNPGALTVLVDFASFSEEIDPDEMFPNSLRAFDSHGILESKIWMLYKDVCKEKIVCVHAVMRSLQLGLEKEETIYHAIENRGAGLDTKKLIEAVQSEVPNFAKTTSEAAEEEQVEGKDEKIIDEKPEAPKMNADGSWVFPVAIAVIAGAVGGVMGNGWNQVIPDQFPLHNQ